MYYQSTRTADEFFGQREDIKHLGTSHGGGPLFSRRLVWKICNGAGAIFSIDTDAKLASMDTLDRFVDVSVC